METQEGEPLEELAEKRVVRCSKRPRERPEVRERRVRPLEARLPDRMLDVYHDEFSFDLDGIGIDGRLVIG